MENNLKKQAKKLPLNPGVYRWLDQTGRILYIGRATSLRKRVWQYFRPDLDPRIAEMVARAKKIKFEKTDNVLEAIILEAIRIKKYHPKYNIRDRDDRSFIYVVIPRTDFAYPMLVRERELKKFPAKTARIFGPYQNAYLMRQALKLLRRIFPYGTCRPNSGQPCFDYQIGLCPGGCIGAISAKDYKRNIDSIALILSGNKKRLVNKLKKENPEALRAFQQLQDVTLITRDELTSGGWNPNRIEGYDISHLSGKETVGAMAVFSDGLPDKNEYRLFNIRNQAASDDLRALGEVISRRLNHGEWRLPDIFLIDGGKPQIDFLRRIFKEKNIAIPLIGISKFGNDKLVFAPGARKSTKELARSLKEVLLKVRDEAHRFGNMARKRKMRIGIRKKAAF